MNRRKFARTLAGGMLPLGFFGGHAWAQASKSRIKFAVIGIDHEHIFRMVNAVREGGGELAMIYAENPDPNHAAKFYRENPQVRQAREEREVLERSDISLVVSAIRPADRAALGIRVMRAGKDFMADKGGFLSLKSLAEARAVQKETKRIYSISYNERLLMPVSLKVDELLAAGAIGKVTHMGGWGAHGLFGHGAREPWFWTRAGRGGILADIGTHQADQFLYYTRSGSAEVLDAHTANLDNAGKPEFEDFGEVWFKGDGGTGFAQVSFYTGKSYGFLLALTGTEGRMVVDKHACRVVVTGKDGKQTEHLANKNAKMPYGTRLVDDVLARTETAMPQAHTFLASELAVRAQQIAHAARKS